MALNRRQLVQSAGFGALGVLAAPMLNLGRALVWGAPPVMVSTRAVDLVRETTVIDMLGLLTFDWAKLFRWHRTPGTFEESDARPMRDSGVRLFHPAVETGSPDPYQAALSWVSGWNRLLAAQERSLARIVSLAELSSAVRRGRIGILIGFQNSTHFRSVADVKSFYELGQRVSQLTYNERNRLGSGCFEPRDAGLTAFGGEVIAEMNRLGMAVDLSHCGERTTLDALAASTRPALVTHSNCKALVPGQPRCKSDEVIRRLAKAGGVIGLTVVRAFVGSGPAPSVDDLLDHFDHVAKVAGVEHAGLGSDVDLTAIDPRNGRINPIYSLAGLDPRTRVFQIAEGLLRRGYGPKDVALMLGGNFQRALGAIFTSTATPAPITAPP